MTSLGHSNCPTTTPGIPHWLQRLRLSPVHGGRYFGNLAPFVEDVLSKTQGRRAERSRALAGSLFKGARDMKSYVHSIPGRLRLRSERLKADMTATTVHPHRVIDWVSVEEV
jgi:hypothetical protein